MKKEFVIERQGRSFVLYAGLLDAAHEQGLKSISTKLLQVPAKENGNVAICEAVVVTEKGSFSGIGDASPTNVNSRMREALIRMAETRAKARALRDAVNVGVTAFEELGDDDDAEEETLEEREDAGRRVVVRGSGPTRPKTETASSKEITEKQLKAIYAIGRNTLGLGEEEVDEKSRQLYGLAPASLSRREASAFIDLLRQKVA